MTQNMRVSKKKFNQPILVFQKFFFSNMLSQKLSSMSMANPPKSSTCIILFFQSIKTSTLLMVFFVKIEAIDMSQLDMPKYGHIQCSSLDP